MDTTGTTTAGTTETSAPAEQPQRPTPEPVVFLLDEGGLVVIGEDGTRASRRLRPWEMRNLGRRLIWKAGRVEARYPNRIGEGWVDE